MIVFILITIIFVTTSFSFPTTVDHDANHPDLRTVPISTELKDELDSNFWRELGVKVVNDHISRETNNQIAKNIIFFLGDGMSVNTITAARSYIDKSMNVPLSFEKFPYTGMAKNYCIDKQTADSACSTTAYLCGVKAKFETIGVNGNVSKKNCTEAQMRENQTPSIAKWALDVGKDVGFVTTTSVTDASPVGLYGHTTERDWENDSDVIKDGCDPEKTPDIAKQLIRGEVGSKLKVIMGGGRREFRPKTVEDEEIFGAFGRRTGEVDLIEEWKTSKGNKGHYIWNKKQLTEINPNTTDYLLGLFDYGGMKYNLEVIAEGEERLQPSLHEMTAKAIDILSRDPEGFFLFVEGGLIDNAHHDTHATIAVDETVEMAKAVQIALDKVNLTETLIVVTADHAHTMSFTGYAERGSSIFGTVDCLAKDNLDQMILSYANGPGYFIHTKDEGGRQNPLDYEHYFMLPFPATIPRGSETHGGEDISIYAIGPWSHLFTGNMEQHVIPHLMAHASCIGPGTLTCLNN